MELTQEQIQQVENFLTAKKLDYIDVRFEVFDHIVSEIEILLDEGFSFETAFSSVAVKWKKDLEMTVSFLIGALYTRPKIVINKAVKLGRYWFLLSFVVAFFQIFLIVEKLILPEFISENTMFFLAIGVGIVIINGYFYFNMKGLKTTFLFLFEKFILPSLILFVIALALPYLSFFYVSLLIINTFFGYKLYRNHLKVKARWS